MTEPAVRAQITDHVAGGLALLAGQFRGKPRVAALATAYLRQAQDLEDAIWALFEQRYLTDATVGARLDQAGRLLLFPRGALDDDSYRAVLRAVVRARKSSGTAEDVIAVADLALGSDDESCREGHASIWIEPHAPIAFAPAALLAVLRLAKAAGVQIQLITPPAVETTLFTCSTSAFRMLTDAARGLGDSADDSVGGHLTGVIG